MKKTMAALLCCLLLAGTGVGVAAHQMQASAEQVTVTVTAAQGDPAAAAGLIARQRANTPQNLSWAFTIPLADPAKTTAEHCLAEEGSLLWGWPEEGLRFDFSLDTLNANSPLLSFYEIAAGYTSIHPLLGPLLEDLAGSLAPGEEGTFQVSPQAYLDSYPFQVTLSEGAAFFWDSDDVIGSYVLGGPLAEFFRFPFPQEDTWTVHLCKSQGGQLSALDIQPTQAPPDMALLFAQGQTQVFFTFIPGEDGALPSFDQVPGGYGVYRMDETRVDGSLQALSPESLETVYSLSPEEGTPVLLALSPQEDTLFLVTQKDGGVLCTVVDPETKAARQTFSLPMVPERLVPGEGVCLVCGPEGFLAYAQDETGTLTYRWNAPLPEGADLTEVCNLRAAWNGEKLALGLYAADTRRTGLTLAVYDAGGTCLYQATYATSLDQAWNQAGEDSPVSLFYGPEALDLSWEASAFS